MNVIAGIYSTIAYTPVTTEAHILLSNHDTNDISPLWPLFYLWNYRFSGKILIEYSYTEDESENATLPVMEYTWLGYK